MKIAYILNTYPQPSQSFIRREIRALEAQGHQVLRIAMRAADVPLVDAQDREEAAKTHYVLAQGKARLLAALARNINAKALQTALACGKVSEVGRLRHVIYLAEAAYAAQYCARHGAQHIHAHFGTNAAAVAMLTHLLGGPPYSFTVHGPEEFDAPRALSLGTKMRHAKATVAISQFGRSQLCRWAEARDWPRIGVVHCGIEPEKFANPTPVPDTTQGIRVLAIGRLVEQKGQLALVQALTQTKHPIHLTLAGDGEMRAQIEALIAEKDLSKRVTLTGWVDEARIRAELEAAHALVMPSFAEGLPMVVMEAMAAARPVIATYIAGTPELVRPGETGWLVPAGDTAAFADAMDALATTPRDTLQSMADAARTRVLARHDVSAEAAKLAQLIG